MAAVMQLVGREAQPDLRISEPGSADGRSRERGRGSGLVLGLVLWRGGGSLSRWRCRCRWPRRARRERGGRRKRPTQGGVRGSGRPAGGSTWRRRARRPQRRKMRRWGRKGDAPVMVEEGEEVELTPKWMTRVQDWVSQESTTPWLPARGTGARWIRRQPL